MPWSVFANRRSVDAERKSLNPDQLGLLAVTLALNFPDWMQRRVERVTYLDDRTARISEGVMLRWPQPGFFPDSARPRPAERIYVPLDLLTKGPLIGLDGTGPDGSPFPILPYAETTKLGSAGLTSLIWGLKRQSGGSQITHDALRLIDTAVRAAPPIARLLLAVLDDETTELGGLLRDRHPLAGLLRELGANVMLLAPAAYDPGSEVVYRYSYLRTLPWPRPRLRSGLGFKDLQCEIDGLSVGWSASYHLQIDAPPEVNLSRARLYGRYAGRVDWVLVAEDGGKPVVNLHASRPIPDLMGQGRASWPRQRPPILSSLSGGPTPAVLAAAQRSEPSAVRRADTGYAVVAFRPDPRGTFGSIAAVGALTAGLLSATLWRLPKLDALAAGALLLALPVVVLGLLGRPGEHAFATRMLRQIRIAGLLIGSCSLLVAFVLAGGLIDHHPAARARTCPLVPPGKPEPARKPACKPKAARTATTEVPATLQVVVDVTTGIAVLLALLLVAGVWGTGKRGDGRLPEAQTDEGTAEKRVLTPD